jgi:predicted DsbA family dithiol-disulfide isomerase
VEPIRFQVWEGDAGPLGHSVPAHLAAKAGEAGLPIEAFARSGDPELLRERFDQHQEAVESGVTGVPAVRLAGHEALIVGAQPYALYRRWYDRVRGGRDEARTA